MNLILLLKIKIKGFINKFGFRISPKIQCDLLFKDDTYLNICTQSRKTKIRQYHTWSIESNPYPSKNDVIHDPLSIESFEKDYENSIQKLAVSA